MNPVRENSEFVNFYEFYLWFCLRFVNVYKFLEQSYWLFTRLFNYMLTRLCCRYRLVSSLFLLYWRGFRGYLFNKLISRFLPQLSFNWLTFSRQVTAHWRRLEQKFKHRPIRTWEITDIRLLDNCMFTFTAKCTSLFTREMADWKHFHYICVLLLF